ncbi:Ig-like domain-containing protein [Ascidiaceihabitans sp.]|uniref:Ig-like domain-containing protein n=1 Tax=Ascidiaceihabitans sp. TaxID=1872644 RepID=UPI003296B266
MKAIDFVVRDGAGALNRGTVSAEAETTTIQVTNGQEISLNLRQVDMEGHSRSGDDLSIVLSDGRIIVIENYFNDAGEANRLFISADGYLNEVAFVETTDGGLYAQFGPTEQWGKWSPSDDLIYLGRTEVAVGPVADDEVSMLAPLGALLGGGGLGAAGVAAGVGGLAVVGGGGGGGGGGGEPPHTEPTVDNADSTPSVGGTVMPYEVVVTGTGHPGDLVEVVVGDQSLDTLIGDDGTWGVTFDGDNLPSDGTSQADVTVTGGGETYDLDGPVFLIDTTPPEVSVTFGTESNGDIFNASELDGGATVGGTGEAGASVSVTVAGNTQTTTVGDDGSWSVTWPAGTFAGGEYSETMTIVATDALGNASTYSEVLVIDTVSEVVINTSAVGGDGTVNGVEAAGGITLTGSAQAGSTVSVTFGSTTLAATVASDGSWTVDFPASAVASGEYDATVTAVATDANGNSATTTGTVQVDTFVNAFNYTSTAGGADGVINQAEAQSGLVVTGQAEPGSTVSVVLGGVTTTATVAANGSWTATFSSDQLAGGTYTTTMTATATDAAGNTSEITQSVSVDTEAGLLTISPAPVEGDDIINAAEASDGVVLSGTADPSAIVTVTMGGVSHTVVTGANGVWNATFAAGEIAPGTYTANIEATTTDAAGNTRTATDSVQVDTQVDNMSVSANTVAGDGVINASEQASGVTITGTTEPGSSVMVTLGGVTVPATVDANGNWTAAYQSNQITTGEQNVALEVTATDAAGNVATINDTVEVDTLVNTLNFSAGNVAGDNVVNASEASTGISLGGQVEAGSTVVVDFHGTTLVANVDAAGNWSLDVPASAIPAGSYDADITVMATDAHDNTATISDTLRIDTDAPDGPVMASLTTIGDGVRGISIEQTDDDVSIAQVTDSAITATPAQSADNAFGETEFRFGSDVPDGSNLVITATDDAGNTAGTYVVLDDGVAGSTTSLATPGLGNYQVETVDLNFAEEAHLTINEAQLVNLSSNTDQLIVTGGGDDQVTLTGGQAAGTTTVDGADYNIYNVGAGTVLIDDEITVNTVIG